jgi:peptide deformylase
MLKIVTYPDKILKTVSKDVENFDLKLHTFLDKMYETMLGFNGIGLAAIQVANPIRIFIINIPNEEDEQFPSELIEFINPVITETEGNCFFQEGCLSVPEFYEDIERYEAIKVEFKDRFGVHKSISATGLLAIAIQHEFDHLNGKLFIDKLSYARRKKFEKEYKKFLKANKNS